MGSAGLRFRVDSAGNMHRAIAPLRLAFVFGLLLGSLAAQGTAPDRFASFRGEVDQLLAKAMKRERIPGASLLVAFGETVVLAKGYGLADLENEVPVAPRSVFRIGSVTKQFTAAAILKLVDAGKLRLDDQLNDLLPEFAFPGKHITVHQMLNHTSGIKNFTKLGAKYAAIEERRISHQEMYELIKEQPFDFEPGTGWNYSNSGYYLLGVIVEKVSGRTYSRFLARELWKSSGMTETYYGSAQQIIMHRVRGYSHPRLFGKTHNAKAISMGTPFAAGALLSTTRDLHRWNLALHGGSVLSPDSYAKMTTPTSRASKGKAPTYGYGLEIYDRNDRRMIVHSGGIRGFRSFMAYCPQRQLTVVLLYNMDLASPGPLVAQITAAALAVER